MQINSSHLRKKTLMQPERPLSELERIEDAVLLMSNRLGKPFNQDRIAQFQSDLAPYPVEAIEWAMDNWGRNSKVVPSLSVLLQLINSWKIQVAPPESCDPECKANHWKGYGWNDVYWLFKKRMGSEQKEWAESDYEASMCELDKLRADGAPAWRR